MRKIAGDLDILLHRSTDHGNLAMELSSGIQHLLDSRDVRSERRNDDSTRRAADDPLERLSNHLLARRVAGSLGTRAVGDQRQHPLCAELRQQSEVRCLAVGRGLVELEVAGVDHRADRGVDGVSHRIGDRVADPERDDPERSELELVARVERKERVRLEPVLLQLVAQEAAREGRGVDRDVGELRKDVREGADMVLVGVRDQEGADLLPVLLQIRDVGDDEVDPEHLLVQEHQPAVDHDDVVAVDAAWDSIPATTPVEVEVKIEFVRGAGAPSAQQMEQQIEKASTEKQQLLPEVRKSV